MYAAETCPSGFVTWIGRPPVLAVPPVALSREFERKLVASVAPLSFTTAPAWNPVPVIVRMKLLPRDGLGVMEIIAGGGATAGGGVAAGALIVTKAVAAEADAIACTVTVAGFGTAAGAVYSPVESMRPTWLLPPVTPFTDHVTVWFALNFC